jgi:hypothetical protein
MNDLISIRDKIEAKIAELETHRNCIIDASETRANGIANYDRELAKTVLKLKNNLIAEFEGIEIKTLPATLIPAVAKGIIWKKCLEKEQGESGYKGLLTCIESLKAELNGYQSINKNLD